KKGMRYADDSCFAGGKGREIKIDDIIFAVKRAADNSIDPFGLPLLSGKVLGFDEYTTRLEKAHAEEAEKRDSSIVSKVFDSEIPGVRKLDDYTLQLLLTEDYPQIIFFFTLTTGSPQPRECVEYYNGRNGRPAYDRHPATSGAFRLKEWHSNYRIVLARNPNYRSDDFYPREGTEEDKANGLLLAAGRQLPIVDEIWIQIIKAGPPVWTLFDQGYLDRAGIPLEVFNQVVLNQELTPEFKERGTRLDTEIDQATYYWVFNLTDPVMKNKKLRQALSLMLDRREMLERFFNGRGVPAMSIIPPGMEGYEDEYKNPYAAYDPDRARVLLAEAGYPGGIDPATGRALRVSFTLTNSPGSTSLYAFYRSSFEKFNVDLKLEEADWPTVLQKKYKKEFQIIDGGWHADYPDPQNFLQLLYGPNTASSYNEGSYRNPTYDSLYLQMKNMPPGPARLAIIRKMKEIVADDTPVIMQFHPITYGLSHPWFSPFKTHPTNSNQLKFRDLDPEKRKTLVAQWNRMPLAGYLLFAFLILVLVLPVVIAVRKYSRRLR
ncbi:MAG TPA: ABC transporter substrate-binding protein, partial [Leptospiraceae bacterium]|nr:ABC transporter substrate-binding protein [Leptospiraceae bacterium]